ncbi:cell envelope biogenesis protein OmpA [Leisingera methylohalidivorans DSM 14336]|uniref:Cell envelope biogenesis protein OmpA n=1 Tax=Leisingera methylohalidivorans DSM 14336 TaxID=999552 RepID=V9VY65_9RHOB|nr:cell envelope biogenesis protein OmpA [Leisingera methylohalidivorans DSM 14336]
MISAAAVILLPALPVAAEITLPAGASAVSERITALGVYQLPIGPEEADKVPSRRFEGQIQRRTWRVEGNSTVLQILAPLRDQLQAAGFEVLLDCAARDCGGFGFRFGIEVVPSPDMMVDISSYHFLSAAKGDEAVSLLVSRAGGAAFVQMITVHPSGPAATATAVVKPAAGAPGTVRPVELAKLLELRGHAVLTDLEFQSGSTRLQDGTYASLRELADYLAANPQYRLLLVGHTDTVGSLEQNTGISERRAQSVKDRLVGELGADAGRIAVAGAGFLAPLASNLIPEGREANRRVEAVLLGD